MKKYLIPVIIVVVVVVIGIIFGLNVSKKGGEETVPQIVPSTEETVGTETEGEGGGAASETTETGDIGKMNDDIFVEIMAYSTYYGNTNPAEWMTKAKELYAKYGVTPEQVQAYSSMLQKDPQHLQEVAQKYMKRAQELAQ